LHSLFFKELFMDKIIVYVDDADFAQHHLAPMLQRGAALAPTQWIVVACPPRMTRHVSKWVNRSARESWRQSWAEKVAARLRPMLSARGDSLVTVLADGPLVALTEKLHAQHGPARVLDARRQRLGQQLQPVTAGQPVQTEGKWTVPGVMAGLGAVLVLAAE
jgi:hypothetical protein